MSQFHSPFPLNCLLPPDFITSNFFFGLHRPHVPQLLLAGIARAINIASQHRANLSHSRTAPARPSVRCGQCDCQRCPEHTGTHSVDSARKLKVVEFCCQSISDPSESRLEVFMTSKLTRDQKRKPKLDCLFLTRKAKAA